MNKRLLRWLTIIIPVGFMLALVSLTEVVYGRPFNFLQILLALLFVSVGTTLFSTWVFGFIDQREADIRSRATQLEALNTAALALTTELDLPLVLQKVVDISRELVSAHYGALGVLDEEGEYFVQFITSGIEDETRAAIGAPPVGHGLLSILMHEGKALRIADMMKDDRAVGFPKNHPSMRSLIGVPIESKGEVIGDLYLSDKLGSKNGEFSSEDQQVLGMFGTQAAIAIENAKLYRQIQQLAVLEERERFGMDLHDGIIQAVYAVGLMLEDVKRRVNQDPEKAQERIGQAVLSLNDVISDLRNYILNLRPNHFQGRNVIQGIEELGRALRANTFMNVYVEAESVEPNQLAPEIAVDVLHIVQEALANVRKHARAGEVLIQISSDTKQFNILIEDDGVSIDPAMLENSTGDGLHNMSERAAALNGELEIVPRDEGGTRIRLSIPLEG